jgi:DNA-nicking Smr family endonuclease
MEYHLSDVIKETVYASTTLSYAKAQTSEQELYQLKNGQIPWEAQLNLVGFAKDAAREALSVFIRKQVKNNCRCILITYSKGEQKNKPPLIKNLINCWLPQFPEVQAFYSAQKKDGGATAVYVLLQKDTHTKPTRLPSGQQKTSFLVEDTQAMERRRRLMEQDGERRIARVNAREHPEMEAASNSLEEAVENGMLQHPHLDSQRFDGIDPSVNPAPNLNGEARMKYDNERRNQEQEKQLRLGNMPKFDKAPKPRGPLG